MSLVIQINTLQQPRWSLHTQKQYDDYSFAEVLLQLVSNAYAILDRLMHYHDTFLKEKIKLNG